MTKLKHIENHVNAMFRNCSYVELMAARMFLNKLIELKKPEHDAKIQAMVEFQKTHPITSMEDYNVFMKQYQPETT